MTSRVHRAIAGLLATLVLAAASGTAARAETATVGPPDETAAAERPAERPVVKSIFASGSVSFVDLRGKDGVWSLANAGITINASGSGVTTAEVQRTARPGLENVRSSVRHDEQLSKDTSVYVQATASTGDPLREDWGAGAGVVQRLSKQLQLTLDARAARYSTIDPAAAKPSFVGLAVTPGLIITPKGTPLEIAAQAILLRNDRKDWQLGGAVRATYYIGDRDLLFAGLSRYPENELGVVRQSTSVYAGLRRELGQGIGLRVTAEHTRLENTWTARTISVGLEKRF
jgi:YaiO family outer membrane protein